MSAPDPPTSPPDDDITVRRATPADRTAVDRLIRDGLLPGRIRYKLDEADRIRQSLGADRDRETFLVAEHAGRVVGTVAVADAGHDVAHLHWLRVDPDHQADAAVLLRLARAATDHAREFGFLKLTLHAPPDAQGPIAAHYHRLGFEFSRSRDRDGVHVLEFYLDLYGRTRPPTAAR